MPEPDALWEQALQELWEEQKDNLPWKDAPGDWVARIRDRARKYRCVHCGISFGDYIDSDPGSFPQCTEAEHEWVKPL